MPLGLGSNLSRAISKPITPGIVTDNLVLKHQYNAGSVVPCSDGAISLDGSGDYVSFGNDSSLQASGSLTYAVWVYRGTNSASEYIIAKRNSSGGHLSVFTDANGVPQVYFGTQSEGVASEGIPLNKWTHYALTYQYNATDDAVLTHYINGAVKGTHSAVDTDGAHVNNDVNLTLGFRTSGGSGHYWDGAMCNFGYWHTVLTQPQIKSIMNKNYAGLTDSEKTNLVSWWNLDNASFPTANTNFYSGKTGALYYSDGVTGSGLASNTSVVDFVTTNGDELGDDVFGGKGRFDDPSYWGTNNSTVTNGVFLSSKEGYTALNKASVLEDGKIYKFSFDIIDYTNRGNLQLKFNWNQSDPATDAYPNIWKAEDGTGSFYIYFKPGSGTRSTFTIYVTDSNTDGSSYGELTLDNVVVQEVKNAGELI